MIGQGRAGLNNANVKLDCGCVHGVKNRQSHIRRCPWHEIAHQGQMRVFNRLMNDRTLHLRS